MPTDAPVAEVPRIQIEVQVMFFDTDCAQIVHNLAYLRFIETARTLLAEQLGMGLLEMSKAGVFPVLARTEVDYKRSAVLSDKLVVEGWLESVERTRFWCGFEVRRPSDGAVMVKCRQLLAMVQLPSGKIIRVPEHWSRQYAHLRPRAPRD